MAESPVVTRHAFTLAATTGGVHSALEWFDGLAAQQAWPRKPIVGLRLCLDEALTNVARYAYADRDAHQAGVELAVEGLPTGVTVQVVDEGVPFDPTAARPAELAARLEDADIGGHGIRFMRHFLQRFEYVREGSRNRLTLGVDW